MFLVNGSRRTESAFSRIDVQYVDLVEMPCQIGQDIYRLRRKNRELLQQLESNSVLLENRIKLLRRAARTHITSDESWEELPPSPLKRRYESWKARNSSHRVVDALCKSPSSSSSDLSILEYANKHEQNMRDIKKSPAKRIKRNVVCKPGKNLQCSGKAKKMSVNGKKCVFQRREDCYCSWSPQKTSRGDLAAKMGVTSKLNSTSKVNDTRKNQTRSDVNGDLDQSDFSEEFPMSLEEACCVLTYTPDSVFLRRMKQRLEKWKKSHGKENRRVQVCECNKTDSSETTDTTLEAGDGDCKSLGKAIPVKVCSKCDLKKSENVIKCQKKKTSRRSSDSSVGSLKSRISCPPKQMRKENQNNGNNSKTVKIQTKEPNNIGSVNILAKCHCKVEGLHHCEGGSASSVSAVKSYSTSVKKTKSLTSASQVAQKLKSVVKPKGAALGNKKPGVPGKIKVAAGKSLPCEREPATCEAQQNSLPERSQVPESEREPHLCQPQPSKMMEYEERPVHLRSQLSSQVQCAGYDVIAGLVENERQKCTAESCPQRFEELNQFRRKHWFDCHAHPHNVCDHCGDPERQGAGLNDELPTPRETCTRTYMLNSRLFPEPLSETHAQGCCTHCCQPQAQALQGKPPASARSADGLSQGFVRARNKVTLPVLTPRYTDIPPETAKLPPGLQVFPKSKIVVRDVARDVPKPRSVPVVKTLRDTPARTVRRTGMPVPANSLALRFQKGVA